MMSLAQELKEHAIERQIIAHAQQQIWDAVEKGWPEFFVEPPRHELHSGACHKLTRQQIDNGVRAFVLACNLSGGSVGTLQLYELLNLYLGDPTARDAINDSVLQWKTPAPSNPAVHGQPTFLPT